MKRFNFLLLLCLLISIFSCEKDNPISADGGAADCSDEGAFVKRVNKVNGRVYYDSTETKYMILVPNSMDSHDVGFVCSLDKTFQKAGLPVKFSGRYYNYNKTLTRFAGDRFYFLSVETISFQ